MRRAGKDLLSLALMDARNHTLHIMGQLEAAMADGWADQLTTAQRAQVHPPQWLLGYAGWFQEWWIGRNTQRALGMHCLAEPTRLASIEPRADVCYNPAITPRPERWGLHYPDVPSIKAYLLETLECTLELLDKTDESDEALYFFRQALFREDQIAEQFAVTAQVLGLKIMMDVGQTFVPRQALLLPATRWQMGSASGGFHWDNEAAQHEVTAPEFEIDAQPVSWAQFVEFVDEGGYDELQHWSEQGWQWLQGVATQEGRRGPRFVEHIGVASGAVTQTRFGQLRRAAGASSAVHLSWFEADAYARWAGRRLPTEVEWEIAAHTAVGQGFRWGDVWEWTASTLRPYPGFVAAPWHEYSAFAFDVSKVLRGGSFATRSRMKHPKFRGFARPEVDAGFWGFRTCAV